MNKNIAPHDLFYDFFLLSTADVILVMIMTVIFIRIIMVVILMILKSWGLSRETDSCQGVHDQIDPKKLDDAQGWVTQGGTTDKYESHAHNVNAKLELKELANVV